jgi:hypothetical protein
MMIRKHWDFEGGPFCVLCDDQFLETTEHLFFSCAYGESCWDKVHINWDYSLQITEGFYLRKLTFDGPILWRFFLVPPGIYGKKEMNLFSKRKRLVLQDGE